LNIYEKKLEETLDKLEFLENKKSLEKIGVSLFSEKVRDLNHRKRLRKYTNLIA
jgi:hypothetical protein